MFVACYLLLMHAGFHPWVKILSQGWGCLLQAFFQTTGVGDGGGGEGLRSRATGFWLERSIRHWWGGAGGHTAGRRGGGDPAASSGGGAVAAVASLQHPLDSNKAVSWTLIRCDWRSGGYWGGEM